MAVSRSLSSINLSENNIGSEGAKVLAPAIRVSRSLSSINLSDNNIGSEGAKVLAPAIRDSHSLTQINLSLNALCGVRVVDTSILGYGVYEQRGTYTAEGIKAIADAIAMSSLTRLDVSCNILARGGIYLRDAVRDREGFVLVD